MTITADKIEAKAGEKSVALTYKLDPSTKPKTIDLDNGGGRSWMSVYALDGNTLKICSPHEPGALALEKAVSLEDQLRYSEPPD